MGTDIIGFCRKHIKKSWKLAFFSTFLIGILVHIYKFTNTLLNHDSLFNFYSTQNILGSGRWLLSFACQFSSYFDLPWLIGLFSVFLISLTTIVVIEVFEIENPVMIVLTGGLLVTFPAITQTFFYEFTADGYMAAMLFAACAVRLSKLGDNKKTHLFTAAICLCLCCAIYQAYVSFAAVLALCYFAVNVLENRHTTKALLRWIGNQVLIYVVGLAAYYVIWQIVMKISGCTPTTYAGISTLGQMNIQNVKDAIYKTLSELVRFTGEWDVYEGEITVYSLLNFLFINFARIIGIIAFMRSKVYKRKLQMLLLLLSIFAMPIAAFMWNFVSSGVVYDTRMEQSLCILYIFTGVLFCRWGERHLPDLAALLLAIIVFNNGVIANVFYYKMEQCNERTYATAVEMAARIHELDDGTIRQIAIVGGASGFYEEDNELGMLRWCNRNLMYDGVNISLYLSNVLDFQLSYYIDNPDAEMPAFELDDGYPESEEWELAFPLCDTETTEELQDTEEVRAMKCWPAADSVRVIDDTVVIKLSRSIREMLYGEDAQ